MRSFLVCNLMALFLSITQCHCVLAEEKVDYHALLQLYLQGNLAAEQQLLSSPAALPVIEQQLLPAKSELNIKIEPLISQLGHAEFAVRQHASKVLQRTLPSSKLKLEVALHQSNDTEVRWRLKKLLTFQQTGQSSEELMLRLLRSMYYRHLLEIWQEYFDLLEKDPHNSRALLLVRHTDPELVLKVTQERIRPHQKLRYLLALKYAGNPRLGVSGQLQVFSGKEILQAASETYWPVELQPLRRDGTYHWTIRCARLEGNKVTHVLRMSIDQRESINQKIHATNVVDPFGIGSTPGAFQPPGNMVHFVTWPRWDYLFRFERVFGGSYEGVALTSDYNGALRPKMVQTVPRSVKIAKTRTERSELLQWTQGRHFSWAKELYPTDLVDKVVFQTTPSTSKILTGAEFGEQQEAGAE